MAREVVTGPVVCGPVGFRKVPLQSRWGEYVRVTVSAPGALRGAVLVHANGVAQEPRTWNTQSDGALVVDARFPNEDVDQRFALERERPIDLTLTGLEGACEGAVFTVEHGELVPSIDERAWIAELERRGGPKLAARREAARLEADARRQAHYAQWEARQVEVSAEVVAQASLLREAHYAQWEARHEIGEADAVAVSTGVAAGDGSVVAAGGQLGGDSASCASGTCAGGGGVAVSGGVSDNAPCASGTCVSGGGVAASGAVVATTSQCTSGTCSLPSSGGGVTASGGVGDSVPCASGACTGPGPGLGGEAGVTVALMLRDTAPVTTASSPGEWSRPPDATLRATVDTTWVQPPDAQLRATATVESSWEQPFVEPHLQPVAVTTESRVVATHATVSACNGNCAQPVDPALSVFVPAMFHVLFNVAAGASQQQPVHTAQPLPPRR